MSRKFYTCAHYAFIQYNSLTNNTIDQNVSMVTIMRQVVNILHRLL